MLTVAFLLSPSWLLQALWYAKLDPCRQGISIRLTAKEDCRSPVWRPEAVEVNEVGGALGRAQELEDHGHHSHNHRQQRQRLALHMQELYLSPGPEADT